MMGRVLAILPLCSCASVVAAGVAFGELPAGASSTNVISEVRAEICRDHLFDPSLVDMPLPPGYRLTLAAEHSQHDPGIAGLLNQDARYRPYAVGSLCVMSVGSFVVDGIRVNPGAPIPMAFWWVRAAGPRDPRMKGKVEWVQVASWYPRDVGHRDRIIASDPLAQFVDLEVTQAAPGRWRLRLALPAESIEAQVRTTGPRNKRSAPEPGFMSVPFGGKSAGSFWVITYFGHHHQPAQGQWHATGSGVFSAALQDPAAAGVFETFFQDGWSALSGLYGPMQ
jgi:hypothetical protein